MKTMMKIIIAAVALMALFGSGAFAQTVVSRGDAVARVASRTSFGSVLSRDAVGSGQSVSRSSAIASASTSRLFDVDGYDFEEDDDGNIIINGNECFVEDDEDDFFPEDQDDPGNAADRGQWVKCLPPVLAVLGQARGKGEELYPNLQNLYNKLRALHESQSTHLYIDIGLDGGCENGEGDSIEDTCMVNVLSEALLGIGTFENDNVQKKFLQDMIKTTDRYIKFLMNNKYAKLEEEYDLGLDYSFDQEEVVPLYLKKILKMEIAGTRMISGVEVPKVKLTQIYTERELTEENNQDQLEGFNMCGDDDLDYETGGACLWVINQERFDALPADQQGGFNNTAINDRVNALFNEDGKLTRKWFTGQDDDENIRLFGNGVKNEVNNGGEFYAHTHMAAFDDAFLRVYTYQHVAERNYPGNIRRVCFCDWSLLAGVTDQTDCTLNYEENNGCQFADEDGGNLDDDATIADEQGWLFDQSSGKTELARTLVDGEWEYLCCRNCQNSDGDAPACKDNYDATKPDDE